MKNYARQSPRAVRTLWSSFPAVVVVLYPITGSIMTRSIHPREVRYFIHICLKPWCTTRSMSPFTQSKMVLCQNKRQANQCRSPQPRIPTNAMSFCCVTYTKLPCLLRYHSCYFAKRNGTLWDPTLPSFPPKTSPTRYPTNAKWKRYN
jgi:hypothetical protein